MKVACPCAIVAHPSCHHQKWKVKGFNLKLSSLLITPSHFYIVDFHSAWPSKNFQMMSFTQPGQVKISKWWFSSMLKVGCSEDPKCVKFRYVWWVPGWNFQKTIFPRSEMFSLTTLKCTWIFRLWQVNPLKSGGKTGRSKPEQQQHLRCNNFGRQNTVLRKLAKHPPLYRALPHVTNQNDGNL